MGSPRFGHGRWPRSQVYAIVAGYWRKGWTVEQVAVKLGLSDRFVAQIFDYLAWGEGSRDPCEVNDG